MDCHSSPLADVFVERTFTRVLKLSYHCRLIFGRIPQVQKLQDKIFLASRALRQDSCCIEALRLLAAYSDGNRHLRLLQEAVKAGVRLLMPVADKYGPHAQWWDWTATRPWMHAILELGEAHADRDNTLAARWF